MFDDLTLDELYELHKLLCGVAENYHHAWLLTYRTAHSVSEVYAEEATVAARQASTAYEHIKRHLDYPFE
jgi:hypothetical protein